MPSWPVRTSRSKQVVRPHCLARSRRSASYRSWKPCPSWRIRSKSWARPQAETRAILAPLCPGGVREGLGDSERADLRIEAAIHDRSPPGLGERIEDASDAADVAAIGQAQGVDGLPFSSPGDEPSEVASSSTNEVDPFLIGDREAELRSHAVSLGQFAISARKDTQGCVPALERLFGLHRRDVVQSDRPGRPARMDCSERAGNLQVRFATDLTRTSLLLDGQRSG